MKKILFLILPALILSLNASASYRDSLSNLIENYEYEDSIKVDLMYTVAVYSWWDFDFAQNISRYCVSEELAARSSGNDSTGGARTNSGIGA